MAPNRLVAAALLLLLGLRCAPAADAFSPTVSASAFVPCSFADDVARRQQRLPPARFSLFAYRGDGGGRVDDAAELYRQLASREARMRWGAGEYPSAQVVEGSEDARNSTSHPAPRPQLQLQRQPQPQPQPQRAARAESNPERRMRMKLKRMEKDLGDGRVEEDGVQRASTATKTKNQVHVESDRVQKKMEADVARLKLQLAEARREAEEGERRAEEAARRVKILSEGVLVSASPSPEHSPTSPPGEEVTVESVRRDNAAIIERLRKDNQRRLRAFEEAAGREKRTLRNRAWSLETELGKQQMVFIAARKEADRANRQRDEIEARVTEMEERYGSRVAELEQEAEEMRTILVRTRSRVAERMVSMRSMFRVRLQRQREKAEESARTVREEVGAEITKIEEDVRRERLVLRRQTIDRVAREKSEKWGAVRSKQKKLEAYRLDMEERIRVERESLRLRVAAVKKETDRKLEDVFSASVEEQQELRKESERALAKAQSEAAAQIERVRKEMAQKIGAVESNRTQKWEELAGRKAAMAEYERERKSLRDIVSLVLGVLRRKLRSVRRERQ